MPLGQEDRSLLRRVPLFAALDDPALDWIAGASETVELASGDVLTAEGGAGDGLVVITAGELEVVKRSRSADVSIARLGPGEIVGEMGVLEGSARSASIRAVAASRVIQMRQDVVLELVGTRPSAAMSIIRTVTGRLRSTEALLREREKLAELGTLSAGLAHELNNPAAGKRDLGGVVSDARRATVVGDLGPEIARRPASGAPVDPLDVGDRADELERYLAERSVGTADELAATLAGGGWEPVHLQAVEEAVPGPPFGVVVAWIASGSEVHALVGEVGIGARRISEIVKAVKDYSYMDQAPVQQVDVAVGLDDTLVILRPKLRAGIEIERDCDPTLPRIEALGSELNQVWTNILDNAIDAMGGTGRIRIPAFATTGRHAARGPRADLRAVLDDDTAGKRHRARDAHRLQRRRPPRGPDRGAVTPGRDLLRGRPTGRAAGWIGRRQDHGGRRWRPVTVRTECADGR
jgi:CRP-like cAMP-binding protein